MSSDLQMRRRLNDLAVRDNVPFSVHVDLTYACDHDCVHCYRVIQPRQELDTGEVKDLLDQLRDLGTFFLTLSGGEATLRGDIWEILEYASSLRFCIKLKTNACGLDQQAAKRLRSLGIGYVDVSLYGARAETHDRVTGVDGSWAATTTNIKKMTDAGLRVNISVPAININVEEMSLMKDFGETLGVTTVDIATVIYPRVDGDESPLQYALPEARARELIRQLSPSEAEPFAAANRICNAGHCTLYVNPYGDVTPCVAFPMRCGNIRQQPFSKTWYNSKELAAFRKLKTSSAGSGDGKQKGIPGCPGLAFLQFGDYHCACE